MSPLDATVVMADGQVVESGPVGDVPDRPRHRATGELVAAIPRLHLARTDPNGAEGRSR